MKARVVILMCAVALTAALVLPCAATATPKLTKLERKVVKLVNQKRTKRGLAKLRVNAKLQAAARSHSAEMAAKRRFSHESAKPKGEKFSKRLIRFGYKSKGFRRWMAGENIAWGGGLYATAKATVNAWMKSPCHRSVILGKAYRDIGLGAAVCKKGYSSCAGPVTFFTMNAGRRIK